MKSNTPPTWIMSNGVEFDISDSFIADDAGVRFAYIKGSGSNKATMHFSTDVSPGYVPYVPTDGSDCTGLQVVSTISAETSTGLIPTVGAVQGCSPFKIWSGAQQLGPDAGGSVSFNSSAFYTCDLYLLFFRSTAGSYFSAVVTSTGGSGLLLKTEGPDITLTVTTTPTAMWFSSISSTITLLSLYGLVRRYT